MLGFLLLLAGCSVPGPLVASPPTSPERRIAQVEAGESVPIRQFARVGDALHPERRIYRGGQPSDEGLQRLAALGVKTIVSFQNAYDQAEETADVAHERDVAARLGMTFINLPLAEDGTPSPEIIQRFLEVVTDPGRQPVFVHCEWGRDRTGAMIAVYRIHEDRYTAEQALSEMESYGYEAAYYPTLEEFVRAYAERGE